MHSYSSEHQPIHNHDSRSQRFAEAIEQWLRFTGDWTDWAKMPIWTADEAAALTLGLSPVAVAQHQHVHYPFIQRFKTVREMIRRAVATGELASVEGAISPLEYLKWANHYELQLPTELRAAIPRIKRFASNAKERRLGSRERDTLLKFIVGLAMGGYGYDPAATKSSTVNEIHNDLALRGINLDAETIRRKLKEAANLIRDELSQAR